MNKKLVEGFKEGNIVVNCKTVNEAKRFIKWCFENNIRWSNRDITCTHFNDGYNICYGYDGYLIYGNYDYYKSQGRTIVSFNEMFNGTFTKDDLKAGQMVECRNGDLFKLLPTDDCICGINPKGIWFGIDDVNENLSIPSNLEIVKVYDCPEYPFDLLTFNISYRKLLWQRKEVKEMTVDEVSKLLGYDVKIVGN